ncbi:PDZ domain-containing protein [Candidatus Berkiella cookevillensis]|uniref:M61 glycyl aminopeptidase n=1 Tax=Candidatus Berkiella cookevillensis TaxID=437022 RepID=A0A0Q9YAF4_9GAMM|nr:PDZ domain-containing protein [Candidatus Berkiella cookevillensis]MCS5708058.1 PDZ domain-containing protein [Candidatus Berkiella cookevillensis]
MKQSMLIEYDITFNPSLRQIEIRLLVNKPIQEGQTLSLPAWTPGSYCIRDYTKHIISIQATDRATHKKVALRKINNNTYECESAAQLEVCYILYANDNSIRGCYCNFDRIFINGSAAFMTLSGFESLPLQVKLNKQRINPEYQVATQLKPVDAPRWGWGTYFANNFDELIDCPIAISDLHIKEFLVDKVPHAICMIGRILGDTQKLTEDVAKICQAQANVFKDVLPFESYLFILHLVDDNYGGLEHRNSSALIASRQSLPMDGNDRSKEYKSLLGLFSHEYFHAWHVKRIKPNNFINLDLNAPAYTTLLWVFEGFTAYYDDLGLVRAGVITREEYFILLVNQIVRYTRLPGKDYQSLAESSFDAWTKYYFPNENSINQGVSYYVKGSLVACLLDMQIRLKSQNQKSLDGIMRILWEDFAKQSKGISESDIENLLVDSGVEKSFLQQAVYECALLPIEDVFSQFGLQLDFAPYSQIDVYYPDAPPVSSTQGVFGWLLKKSDAAVTVMSVLADGAAGQAGICAGDEVVAIDGFKTTQRSYDVLAKRLKSEQTVVVTLFRDNLLKNISVKLATPQLEIAKMSPMNYLSPLQKEMLDDWLK